MKYLLTETTGRWVYSIGGKVLHPRMTEDGPHPHTTFWEAVESLPEDEQTEARQDIRRQLEGGTK